MMDIYAGIKPSTEAEGSVIGSILIKPDEIMPEVMELLSEDDFLVSEYRTLFRTICGYFVDGKPIDVVTLIHQHGEEYKEIIFAAAQSVPTTSNWRSYAEIIKQTAIRHRANQILLDLSDDLIGGNDIPECQEKAVKLCEALNDTMRDTTVNPAAGMARFIKNAQSVREHYKTGFFKLDEYTYISKGDYIVIGGRPSTGKTAFTLQMMLNMAQRHKIAYFSLETSEEKIFDRLIANYFGIPLSVIKIGNIQDWGDIPERVGEFTSLDFHVVEAAGWTVPQIQAKAVQLGAEIIFVDYLGLVQTQGKGRYEKVTEISVDLHTMAQTRKITIIALCQLNREGKGEPIMEHLRESGQIEQDADVVLLLHNLGENEKFDRKLIIAKNKEGKTGAVRFAFDGQYQKFKAIEAGYEYE